MAAGDSAKVAGIVLMLSITAVGCASDEAIVKLYQAPSLDGAPYPGILVVGVQENQNLRRRFEKSVVNSLNAPGTAAIASASIIGPDVAINRQSLVAAAQDTDTAAVRITRVLDAQTRVEYQGGRVYVQAQRRNSVPLVDFFRYDYVEYKDPMTIESVHSVVLATDLYDVADEVKVWSVETTSIDKRSVDELIDSTSRAIARQLERDKLIQSQ